MVSLFGGGEVYCYECNPFQEIIEVFEVTIQSLQKNWYQINHGVILFVFLTVDEQLQDRNIRLVSFGQSRLTCV